MSKACVCRIFFPTRFHIFNQLEMPAFELGIAEDRLELYTIYPRFMVQRGPFSSLTPAIRTLWLGMLLYLFLRTAKRLGVRGKTLMWLRGVYFKGSALEFYTRISIKSPGLVLATAGYLGKGVSYLRRAGHTVVISHGSLYERYVAKRMLSMPKAIHEETANWTSETLLKRMDTEFEDADGIIVCSPMAQRSFPTQFHKKISVVPLGATLKERSRASIRTKDLTVFLHVSNLSFGKNVTGVLDAFNRMRSPSDVLWIAGPSPRDTELRNRLKHPEPGVVWLGQLDRASVDSAMASADIFVHPSFADGWGMVITEALSAGLPVVSSPETGAASYYANASNEGTNSIWLANAEDIGAIKNAMKSARNAIVTDPALRTVIPMSWEKSAEELLYALRRYGTSEA